MRHTTGWAVCGIVAGTVVLGAGGTFATFSDSEILTTTAGAGRLALTDPAPPGQTARQLVIGPAGASLPVVPDVLGDAPVVLRLSAVGAQPCDAAILLTVTPPLPGPPVVADLCTLTGGGVELLAVDERTPELVLPVTVTVTGDVGPAARQWRGELVLTLVQADEEGFSDELRMPVHVVAPNPQRPAAAGTGNGRATGPGHGDD